jgi:ribosomal protein L39E
MMPVVLDQLLAASDTMQLVPTHAKTNRLRCEVILIGMLFILKLPKSMLTKFESIKYHNMITEKQLGHLQQVFNNAYRSNKRLSQYFMFRTIQLVLSNQKRHYSADIFFNRQKSYEPQFFSCKKNTAKMLSANYF